MIFVADEMLGKLVRWLRALGVDVIYETPFEDEKILGLARKDRRFVLTRDQKLFKRLRAARVPSLFIERDRWPEQMQEIFSNFPRLKTLQNVLSRCMECNETLETIDKEKVKDRVWPYVYETQNEFSYCRHCDRVYWQATHVGKILERLKKLVEES